MVWVVLAAMGPMLGGTLSEARAEDVAAVSLVALKVTGPSGSVMLEDELVLPSERMLPGPDGKHSLGIYVATMPENRALVELAAGKPKDGKPKPTVTKSFELDAFAPQTQTLIYKKSTWTIEAVLGSAWGAPDVPEAPADATRYALAWDDAKLMKTEPPPPLPPEAKKPKKAPPPPETVVERELPDGRTNALEMASPVKIVAAHDNKVIAIETVPTPGETGQHCQIGGPAVEPYAQPFFVALGDFVPRLTSREVVGKFPDGTGYRVAAGVVVVAEGEGTFRVSTGGLSFLIQATEEDLAFYYKPSTHFPAMEGAPIKLQPGVIGKTNLGDVSFTGPVPLPIAGLRGVRSPIATVRVPCAEVRLSPATSAFVR